MTPRRSLRPRGLLAAALGSLAAGPAAAQLPEVIDNNPGYLILKVNLTTGAPAAGGTGAPGGGPKPGSEGDYQFNRPPMPSGPGGYPGGSSSYPGSSSGPGGMGPGGAAAAGPQPFDPTKFVVAVVPYQKVLRRPLVIGKNPTKLDGANPKWTALQLSNERNAAVTSPFLYIDNSLVQAHQIRGTSPEQSLAAAHKKWVEKGRPLEGAQDLVTEALAAGLPEKAAEFFAELAKQVEVRKDAKPPEQFVRAAKAFQEVAPLLEQPLPPDPAEEAWRERLKAAGVYEGTHYALIHYGDTFVSPEALARRAATLDRNYKLFYLWHALNGRAPKPPAKRLTAVLVGRSSDLARVREGLDGGPVASDSFFSPTHNLLVLSPERMDDSARAFARYMQGYWQSGWSREDLVKGKGPAVGPKGKAADEVFRMMTLALVDRKLEEEGEYAAVSREGTRQLYAASGELAPYVVLPGWVESGSGSLFAKPKGPVFNFPLPGATGAGASPGGGSSSVSNQPASMTVGLLPGYGGPNYAMVRKWRDLVARRDVNPDPASLLRYTITDRYVDAARAGTTDADPLVRGGPGSTTELAISGTSPGGAGGSSYPGGSSPSYPGMGSGPPGSSYPGGASSSYPGMSSGPSFPGGAGMTAGLFGDPMAEQKALAARLDTKSQVTAWALTYYLTKNRPDRLQRFYADLGRMPRDMHLDPDLVLTTFCRAFDLLSADGASVDEDKFTELAKDWLRTMNTVKPNGTDVPFSAFGSDPTSTGTSTSPGSN